MALVQACTHAFQHKEGWLNSMPAAGTRIVSASDGYKGGKASVRGGVFSDRGDLVQKFDVSCRMDDPKPCCSCGTKVCIHCKPAQKQIMPVVMQPAGMGGYFADWNTCAGQPMMIVPTSPFYPGVEHMKKLKKKKGKKHGSSCSDDDEEVYFVRRSDLLNHQGDSLRSRIKTREEIITEEISCPPRPRPCPPQVIMVPQPQPSKPKPETSFKNQQNPNTDVIVYAPQVINANKKSANFNYDDRDNEVLDYHPDGRRYWNNNERRLYDAREDNHVDYQQGYYSRNDYRADQRAFNNREDNRRLDYRSLQYEGGPGFEDGYYDAQLEDYNAQVLEYNQQLVDYYGDEEDGGYFADDYCAQPGYSDDCGVGDYVRYAQEPQGRYVLDYVDEYAPAYGQPAVAPTAARAGYMQVADGLGYYP